MGEAYVGILLNASAYRGIPLGRTQNESLSAYEEAGQEFGITPCYFRLADIEPGEPFTTAYVKSKYGYIRKSVPTPHVVHNRAIYFKSDVQHQIRSLIESGIYVFNEENRYGKLYVHELLRHDLLLKTHLPETLPLNPLNLHHMMEQHADLILKPNNSSLGRGVMKLRRVHGIWHATYPVQGRKTVWRTVKCRMGELPGVIQRKIGKEQYLIQQYIPLAKYNGRPFDLRVSVQRSVNGEWQITGMIARVAAHHRYVTNLAKGGTSLPADRVIAKALPNQSKGYLMNQVSFLSMYIVKRLEVSLPHLADVGLDIGLTENGIPMFIECNGRDQRYSFREAGLTQVWKSTFRNPMAYASHLMKQHNI
ncbi:YheC/YheD family endospore coat-associated protein [Paenibacillus guangzhouensis]|uniref:YheC/YheD family endospore coat-associated protein n=1 Tax=Paenibacillus guangzhouensis TaxID=1473112 RepID=UPI00187B3588|nr:YheC/YheD family protein [Paenibacillus guangzhouensis]